MELELNVQEIDSRGGDLNHPIGLSEVTSAVNRAKLDKAAGIDGFIAEVVKNKVSIQFLHALYSFCFEHGISPQTWPKGSIHPNFNSGMNDRDPYMTLIHYYIDTLYL